MKRFLCFLLGLLLSSDNIYLTRKYHCQIILQNHQVYHEHMIYKDLLKVVGHFVSDSTIESVFITRDLECVTDLD